MDLGVLSCPPQTAGTLMASHAQIRHSLEAGTAKDSDGGKGRTSQAVSMGPESWIGPEVGWGVTPTLGL